MASFNLDDEKCSFEERCNPSSGEELFYLVTSICQQCSFERDKSTFAGVVFKVRSF